MSLNGGDQEFQSEKLVSIAGGKLDVELGATDQLFVLSRKLIMKMVMSDPSLRLKYAEQLRGDGRIITYE